MPGMGPPPPGEHMLSLYMRPICHHHTIPPPNCKHMVYKLPGHPSRSRSPYVPFSNYGPDVSEVLRKLTHPLAASSQTICPIPHLLVRLLRHPMPSISNSAHKHRRSPPSMKYTSRRSRTAGPFATVNPHHHLAAFFNVIPDG